MSDLNLPVLLTPQETAEVLRVSVGTLAQWRFHKRVDLPFLKIGAAIRYRQEDVEKFLSGAAR